MPIGHLCLTSGDAVCTHPGSADGARLVDGPRRASNPASPIDEYIHFGLKYGYGAFPPVRDRIPAVPEDS